MSAAGRGRTIPLLGLGLLLQGCGGSGGSSFPTNCTMTLAGEGADPSLRCVYAASPTQVSVSVNGGPYVETWGLVVHGFRDDAQEDQAVVATVIFDPGSEPAAATYACSPASDPAAPWSADALRGSSPAVLTHSMHSPREPGYAGRGSLSVTFTSVTSSSAMDAPTHGALDASLVAIDGSGKTLALRVDF